MSGKVTDSKDFIDLSILKDAQPGFSSQSVENALHSLRSFSVEFVIKHVNKEKTLYNKMPYILCYNCGNNITT